MTAICVITMGRDAEKERGARVQGTDGYILNQCLPVPQTPVYAGGEGVKSCNYWRVHRFTGRVSWPSLPGLECLEELARFNPHHALFSSYRGMMTSSI